MFDNAQARVDELNTINRAVDVAFSNLRRHTSSLGTRFLGAQSWLHDIVAEQKPAIDGWRQGLARVGKIPVQHEVVYSQLFAAAYASAVGVAIQYQRPPSTDTSMQSLLDPESINQAATRARAVLEQLVKTESKLAESVQAVVVGCDNLLQKLQAWRAQWAPDPEEERTRIMDDVDVVTKRIESDCEHVLSLADSSKSASQASKKALVHTQELLPSLMDNAIKLAQLQRKAVEERNGTATAAVQYLQAISALESALAETNQVLTNLDVSPEGFVAFEILGVPARLPYIYGSVLIETVRRSEWHEKVTKDSSVLAEELAVIKDEEERRRKRWHRTLGQGQMSDVVEDRPISVEVNLRGNDQRWPHVERRNIDEYLAVLGRVDGMENMLKELKQSRSELDRPARRRSKRIRAFKHDSVHDLALSRSSLMLKEKDDLLQTLQDEKIKLAEKLKGSESRVRKLEDIVHRQGDMSRNATGNVFQSSNGYRSDVRATPPSTAQPFLPSSRPQDALSRRSSVSSRRFSANQGADERALLQKILSLEAELSSERERVARLQKDTVTMKEAEESFQARIGEAESTKKDLMDNLEAQQREFSEERRFLQDDGRKLKVKLEELEDELDRVLGSRDHEKTVHEEKARDLTTALELARKASQEENRKLVLEVQDQKALAREISERALEAERQAQQKSEEVDGLEVLIQSLRHQLQTKEEGSESIERDLQATYWLLRPTQAPPTDLFGLVNKTQELIQTLLETLHHSEESLAIARLDKESLRAQIDHAEAEHAATKEKLNIEEMESFGLRETLARESGKLSALEAELSRGKVQLEELRARFADEEAESASKALRKQLDEEEATNVALRADVAAMQAEMTVYEQELHKRQEIIQAMQSTAVSLKTKLKGRTDRALDLSQRLFIFNDRLNRLLETVGFVVTYQNGTMSIQRVSKVMSASGINATDSASHGTQSTSPKVANRLANSVDLHFIHWIDEEDSEKESRMYAAYLDTVTRLDVDSAYDAVANRMKDTEHVARKWQKEARLYRDRALRAHSEAHEKIAYRSFREGDLALFLPTRNQATRPWAAFNVGAPHYFLREQDSHKLQARDWLLARISKVEERVVDLSRMVHQPPSSTTGDGRSIGGSSDGGTSMEDENPFELSDGLRWYFLDAAEEKPGAPSTPGLGKSTVASANVDARGSIRVKKSAFSGGVTKTLSKNLDSRRNSSNSKKGVEGHLDPLAATLSNASPTDQARHSSQLATGDDRGQLVHDRNQAIIEGEGESFNGAQGTPMMNSAPATDDHNDQLQLEVRHNLLGLS